VAVLPRPPTSFIGRERELAALVARLRDEQVRLLTLTGPGGVGKTRLALRAASEASDIYSGGVWFVALAPVRDPALVPAAIAHALGVRESAVQSHEAAIEAFLRDRRALLILDNFEHLLDAAPPMADLLTACPSLTILATSRAVLRITGEHDIAVPPMSLPGRGGGNLPLDASDGVRLFVERARAARADFTLTQANEADIAEVCRRLDGLPLAIELAAARVRHLPPRTLLNRMGQRLPLLTDGPRDQPARLRTMRDAITWSHDLLAPDEQIVFRRLSVFVGGFTLEAAEAVWTFARAPGMDVLAGVMSLLDGSLLHRLDGDDDDPRFGMLETIREFAQERLTASGEEAAIRAGHADWCLAIAEQTEIATWGGPEQTRWLDRLEAELPNLRGALAWLEEAGDAEGTLRLAGALLGLWYHRSHRAEGHTLLERALSEGNETPTAGRARAQVALAKLGMFLGSEQAGGHAAEGLVMWTELGDVWRAADARLALGMVLNHQADYEQAAPLLEDVAAQLDALEEPARAAIALLSLGQATLELGDSARAEEILEEVLGRFRQGGYEWALSMTLGLLGQVAANRSDVSAAAAYYAESLVLAGKPEDLVSALVRTARLAAAGRRASVATRVLGAAAAIAETVGYPLVPPLQARCQDVTANARADLGDANFEAAWGAGQLLSVEQAVAEALAVLATIGASDVPRTVDTRANSAPEIAALTAREREVLVLMCAHLQDREIAEHLFLSPRTVEGHVSHILAKLGVRSRREAMAVAARRAPM
jgi:non-specific serine/threonine protein kinase